MRNIDNIFANYANYFDTNNSFSVNHKDDIDYGDIVFQFLRIFDYYCDYIDNADNFRDNYIDAFCKKYNCEFNIYSIMKVLNYNDDIKSFFIGFYGSILEFDGGNIDLNDKHYMQNVFFSFNKFYKNPGVTSTNEVIRRMDNDYLPNLTIRYGINKLISQFSHDVINGKIEDNSLMYQNSSKLINCFIYLCILTQFNKVFSIELDGSNHSFSDYLKNHFNTLSKNGVVQVNNNKLDTLRSITNIFAHQSGNIGYLLKENKLVFKNFSSMEITIDIDEFLNDMNNLFEQELLSVYDKYTSEHIAKKNRLYSDLKDFGCVKDLLYMIDKISNNDLSKIEPKQIILLMGYLEICFNQENLLNNTIMSQYGLIDASKFSLNYGQVLDQDKIDKIDIFKSHNFVYSDIYSKNRMERDWGNYINNIPSADDKGYATICDTRRMCFDKHNAVYFPTSEIIKHLRNSLRHGRLKVEGDIIYFWDQAVDNDPSTNYFFLEITVKDFLEFLSNSVLHETMHIQFNNLYENRGNVKDYKNSVDHTKYYFYSSEVAYSRNSFKNFIDICRTRFYDLSEEDFIDVLCDNHLLSRYLSENVDAFPEFLEYELPSGRNLIDLLLKKYNSSEKLFTDINEDGISFVESLKHEMSSLINMEKKVIDREDTVFFNHYFNYLLKKNFVFDDIDVNPVIISDKVKSAKIGGDLLLSNLDYNDKATNQMLLSIALSKYKNFDELTRLYAVFYNYLYIRANCKDDIIVNKYDYNNSNILSPGSLMYDNSSSRIVKKLKTKSIFYKLMSKYFNIIGISGMSSLLALVFNSIDNINSLPLAISCFITSVTFSSLFVNNYSSDLDSKIRTTDLSIDIFKDNYSIDKEKLNEHFSDVGELGGRKL